ncbi:MAG: hypothetical protein HY074_05140, partial [Deltaproteobacteria bacterium]|nr:hypothetical protein [Deltaproteobacteria bacterium]
MLLSLSRTSLPFMAIVFAVSTLTGLAARADGPISNNPDDYDVAKYQRLTDNAAARLRNARELLESLNRRFNEIGNHLANEQAELDALGRDAGANRQTIENSEIRIRQLRQSIETSQRELAQLQNEIPAVEVALLDEQRRHATLADHVAQAEQNATSLEAMARDRAARSQSLSQNADQKRQALAQAQAQLSEVTGKLQAAEAQRIALQKKIDDLRVSVPQVNRNLEAAKAAAATLETETAAKLAASQQAQASMALAEKEAADAERLHAPDALLKRRKANAARQAAVAAKSAYDASDRALTAARAQIASLDSALTAARTSLASAEQQFAAVDNQVVALRQQVAAFQPAVIAAQRESQQAQALAAAAATEAAQAQTQAMQARQTATDIRAGLASSEKKMGELQERVNQLHQRKSNLETAFAGWNTEIAAERQKIEQGRQRDRQLAEAMERKSRRVREIQAEYDGAGMDRDRAVAVARDTDHEFDFYRHRLAAVNANLAQGVAIAANDGMQDGGIDGASEGVRQGALRGQREGIEIGEREGRAQGLREGVERARLSGANDGQTVGTAEGTEKGTAEGRQQGQLLGTSQGREKGLTEGFEAGKSEGYAAGFPKGEEAGHAMGGLKQGADEGYAQGKARAQAEGSAKGAAQGTLKGHETFNNANLSDATLPNHAAAQPANDQPGIAASPSDVKSANFDRPDWGNYNPHRGYPHAEMQRSYNDSYQRAFYATAADSYDRTYPSAYDRSHRESFDRVRADYANREYPEQKKAAFDAAYSAARNAAFGPARDAAYRDTFAASFEAARQAALPERKEEGRAAGTTEGFEKGKSSAYDADLAQGRQDGDKAGWNENYQPSFDAAFAAAYAKVVAYFSQNAVLKFDGAVAADANADGVYAPGESVSLTVAIKNFGKVSQARGGDVTVVLSAPTAGLVLDSPTDTIVQLPGQTRTVVTGVTSFRIAPTAEAGKTESLTMTLLQAGNAIGQATISITVGYPYAVSSIEHSDYPSSGMDNAISVKVRNGSSKSSANAVTARLVSLDGLATISGAAANLGALAAGETKTAPLSFTFTDANANKVLNFEVQIFEGDWLLGKRRFSVDSAKRWQYNADTTGLFVLSAGDSGKRADDASKLAGLGFDAFDVRVEGQLTSETALKYLDKAIVIPSVNSALGDGTAAALKDFLEHGGRLYAGQSDGADRTAVGSVIASFAGNLTALQIEDLAVYQGNGFKADDSKSLLVVGQDA